VFKYSICSLSISVTKIKCVDTGQYTRKKKQCTNAWCMHYLRFYHRFLLLSLLNSRNVVYLFSGTVFYIQFLQYFVLFFKCFIVMCIGVMNEWLIVVLCSAVQLARSDSSESLLSDQTPSEESSQESTPGNKTKKWWRKLVRRRRKSTKSTAVVASPTAATDSSQSEDDEESTAPAYTRLWVFLNFHTAQSLSLSLSLCLSVCLCSVIKTRKPS